MRGGILFIEQEVISILKGGVRVPLNDLVKKVAHDLEIYSMEDRVESMVLNMVASGKIFKDEDDRVYFQ